MAKIAKTPALRRVDIILQAAFVLLNIVAFNVLVHPARARVDLTEEKLYTLSDVTRKTLAELPDKVELLGYFTPDVHPKLSPFIPKIRDLCEEMRQASGGKLEVTFVDPKSSEDVEKEANKRFNVRASAFPLASATESGIKNAFYDVIVSYGDVFQRLAWQDLVEIRPTPGQTDVDVRLRNIEFAIVNALLKCTREFGTLEARLLSQKEPAKVTFLLSAPEHAPEAEKQAREFLEKRQTIAKGAKEELEKRYKSAVSVAILDPSAEKPDARATAAVERYGVRPVRFSRNDTTYFIDCWVELAGKAGAIDLRDHPDHELTQTDVVQDVEAAIRRMLPGALKKIGLVTPRKELSPQEIMMMQRGMRPPQQEDPFQQLRAELGRNYEVADVDLSSGKPPLDVDMLCLLRPTGLSERARFALDQYVMFGGKLAVFVDRAEFDPEGARMSRALRLKPVEPGLDDLLSHWGVTVRKELLLDEAQFPLTVPVPHDLGGIVVEELKRVPYPWFPLCKGDQIDRQNPVIGKIDRLVFLWPSPLSIDAEKTKGLRVSTLVRSSDRSWTSADVRAVDAKEPTADGKPGYAVPEKTHSEPIAVAIEGSLTSAFDAKTAPTGTATPLGGLEPLSKSPATTRLVIVGNATFLSDLAPGAIQEQQFQRGVEFFNNICDWALLDDALIQIRGRGAADRSLKTLDKTEKEHIAAINFAAPALLVILVGLGRAVVRKRAKRRVRA